MANKTWVGTDVGNEGDWGTAANWSPSGVPLATDDVRIPAGTNAISGTLDQSAVALGDVIVEAGYTAAIGTSAANLQIDPNRFEFAGTGTSFIDLGTANIDVLITNTATAATGLRGLYLIGSSLNSVSVSKGKVGIASRFGTTATVVDLRVSGAGDVVSGEGTTLTNVVILGGQADIRCVVSGTLTCNKGTATTNEVGTVATATINGGTANLNATGTITTLNLNGGATDFTGSGLPRTVTTVNLNPGAALKYDPNVMTLSTISEANAPISITSSRV